MKVGIIGFAHGHIPTFAGEWIQHSEMGIEVALGWDHDVARRDEWCEKLHVAAADSLEALLASDIGAVVIGNETNLHADAVEQAAAAGKAIILYKPMCFDMAQADRIVQAVNRTGVRFSMGWQMRCDPQNQRIRQMIQEQTLGGIHFFRRRHGLPPVAPEQVGKWWQIDPQVNRDLFFDDASHPVNLMQWIFGMPETVMCEQSTMWLPGAPNDNDVALFRYANGMIAEIHTSFTTFATEPTTEVYAAEGTILQYFGDLPGVRVPHAADVPGLKWYQKGENVWHDSGIPSPDSQAVRIRAQAKPLAAFLLGGPTICSAEEGRDTTRLMLACYLSAKEGRRVSVWDQAIDAM